MTPRERDVMFRAIAAGDSARAQLDAAIAALEPDYQADEPYDVLDRTYLELVEAREKVERVISAARAATAGKKHSAARDAAEQLNAAMERL